MKGMESEAEALSMMILLLRLRMEVFNNWCCHRQFAVILTSFLSSVNDDVLARVCVMDMCSFLLYHRLLHFSNCHKLRRK